MKQQMFLEHIDRKERENNLIVLGVPEDTETLDGATNDGEKLEKLWSAIGTDILRVSYKRLGRTTQTGRKRPILVTVGSKDDKDKVLENTHTLRQAGDLYARMYVKKTCSSSSSKRMEPFERCRDK